MTDSNADGSSWGMERTNESRRRILAAVGASLAAGLAGCSSDGTDGGGDGTGTGGGADGDGGDDTGDSSAGDAGGSDPTETDEGTPTEEEGVDLDREFDGWSTHLFDDRNTGYAPEEAAPTGEMEVLWTFESEGWPTSAPLVADNTVYVGTQDGFLHAVDARTATAEWTVEFTEDYVDDLAMADGTLYAPTSNNSTADVTLYALDPTTGNEQWTYTNDGSVDPPSVADGLCYFGSNDDTIYALDAATGEEQWTFETGANAVMKPAVIDGTVLATEYDPARGIGSDEDSGDGVVYALDAATGEEQWRFDSLGACQTSPAVENGTVYVGATDGFVYALDLATGEEQWTHETFGEVKASITVADGTLYVVPQGDTMWGLDAETGEKLWRGGSGLVSIAASVADGTAFVVADESIKAFDGETGEEVWEFEVDDRPWSPATVADGTVFFGTNQSVLYALSDQ